MRKWGDDMNKFNGEEIVRIINALNGGITPIGETNVDNQRYENLKTIEIIISYLLDDIQLLIPNINRYEYSMKRIGDEAVRYLQGIRAIIDEWMKDYGVEE